MNTKTIFGFIIFLFVITGFAVFIVKNNVGTAKTTLTSVSTTVQKSPATTTVTGSTTPSTKVYTLADISSHKSQSSCWSAINGKVYDLTDWIRQHPGGAIQILSICGIDGSTAYNQQHGGQRQPQNDLASMYIGDLSIN